MPTEQEMIDSIVLDEDVPHFIKVENRKIRALFKIARHRRGAPREEAFDELQDLIESLLHSQYISYVGIIGSLKMKAHKAWIAEDCSKQVIFLTKSVDKLLLQVTHWKQAYDRLTVRESELIVENISLKNKLEGRENGVNIVAACQDEETTGEA